jgi:hypothetical protein
MTPGTLHPLAKLMAADSYNRVIAAGSISQTGFSRNSAKRHSYSLPVGNDTHHVAIQVVRLS